jgi:hypothetical protein
MIPNEHDDVVGFHWTINCALDWQNLNQSIELSLRQRAQSNERLKKSVNLGPGMNGVKLRIASRAQTITQLRAESIQNCIEHELNSLPRNISRIHGLHESCR